MTSWPHLRADTDRTVNSRLAGDRTEDVIVKYSNDIILLIRMYLRVSDDHLTQWSPGQPGVYNQRTPPTRGLLRGSRHWIRCHALTIDCARAGALQGPVSIYCETMITYRMTDYRLCCWLCYHYHSHGYMPLFIWSYITFNKYVCS